MAQWVKYNGVLLPPIKADGLKFDYPKVWSKNTGRNNSADMMGTIIKVKKKIEISFVPLNYNQVTLLKSLINNASTPFPKVEYQLNSGEKDSFYAYSGDLTGGVYMDTPLRTLYTDFKVSIIEK